MPGYYKPVVVVQVAVGLYPIEVRGLVEVAAQHYQMSFGNLLLGILNK